MNNEKPYWWPQEINEEYINQIRLDYPEKAHMSDDELSEYFDEGKLPGQFATTWDHVGDAYCEYEKLAKAFLYLVSLTGKKPEDFLNI